MTALKDGNTKVSSGEVRARARATQICTNAQGNNSIHVQQMQERLEGEKQGEGGLIRGKRRKLKDLATDLKPATSTQWVCMCMRRDLPTVLGGRNCATQTRVQHSFKNPAAQQIHLVACFLPHGKKNLTDLHYKTNSEKLTLHYKL